jgi:hypothetical protein
MMLIGISTLKNSYFYNEFKNDWNYGAGKLINSCNMSNIIIRMKIANF